jgi:putative sterol carrier protein
MSDISIQSIMDRLCGAFVPERAEGINETIQFQLNGDQGGDWVVSIKDQTCSVEQGTIPNPTLRFSADAQDALDILAGRMDPMRAFMRGKLRLDGDMGLAMKMTKLFDVQKM